MRAHVRTTTTAGLLYFVGQKKVSGNVSGDISGNVSGNVPWNVSGNVSGNVPGNVSGNVPGNVPVEILNRGATGFSLVRSHECVFVLLIIGPVYWHTQASVGLLDTNAFEVMCRGARH